MVPYATILDPRPGSISSPNSFHFSKVQGPYGERAKPQIRELVLVGPKGRTLPGKEEEEPYGY